MRKTKRTAEDRCPRCGYGAEDEAAAEAQLAAVRRAVGPSHEGPLTYSQAARRMGVSLAELRRVLAGGEVFGLDVAGRPCVPSSEVQRWTERRRRFSFPARAKAAERARIVGRALLGVAR